MFKNIFKSETENEVSNRIALTDEIQINDIIESSTKEAVLIFKHSTRCGISSMMLKRFDNKIKELATPYYLLDVLKYRPLSILIQDKFNVIHQSPQLLVVKNGQVVDHDSHSGVLGVLLRG